MKMYIIVKDNIPDKLVPVITAHASLACYKKYRTYQDMKKWIAGIFKKVQIPKNVDTSKYLSWKIKFIIG